MLNMVDRSGLFAIPSYSAGLSFQNGAVTQISAGQTGQNPVNPPAKSIILPTNFNPEKTEDMPLNDDFKSKFRVSVEQGLKLPGYIGRGLKGDPDANFFEFLKLSKIPYLIGGPVLVAIFAAGGKGSIPLAKQKGVGVGLYYLGAALAAAAINIPVKIFRGVDLNRPYRSVICRTATDGEGISLRKDQYGSLYESINFMRTDLLERNDAATIANPRLVNSEFNKIARKMGVKGNLNDADSAVKPNLKKLVAMTKAWKYALLAPVVTIAVGMAGQDCWAEKFAEKFGETVRDAATHKTEYGFVKDKLVRAGKVGRIILKENFLDLMKKSFKGFWKGSDSSLFSKIFGKFVILGAAAMMIGGNIKILMATSLKQKRFIDYSQYPEMQKFGNQGPSSVTSKQG